MSVNPPIVVLSNVIVDAVRLADGRGQRECLGGAAAYAAVAARMWWNEAAIVAGIGNDFPLLAADSLVPHALRGEGLLVRDAHTIRSRLVYSADGERSETPLHGRAHFARLQLTPADIPASLLPAAGTYVFRDLWPAFWHDYAARRARLGIVLWEFQADAERADDLADLAPRLRAVDLFSLNVTEARNLLGPAQPREWVMRLIDAGAAAVVLRMGADGALVGDGRALRRLRPPMSRVVDVTGGGNAFCGGFLAGWCTRPGDVEHAARCAAASAALTLAQHGLPPPADRDLLARLYADTRIEPVSLP